MSGTVDPLNHAGFTLFVICQSCWQNKNPRGATYVLPLASVKTNLYKFIEKKTKAFVDNRDLFGFSGDNGFKLYLFRSFDFSKGLMICNFPIISVLVLEELISNISTIWELIVGRLCSLYHYYFNVY